jgi:pyruvate dehydrogenase E2 component (dihydrolipoyllysine-residue acetyltransferase)
MATEVQLPALGESVTEGTVTQWLKSVGDSVAVDEPLLEVSTDKVDTEVPSPVAGTLLEIRAEEDETVEVGAVLAVIGDEGESSGSADKDAKDAAQSQSESQQAETADEEQAAQGTSEQAETVDEEQTEQADEPAQMPDGDPQTDEGARDQPPSEQAPAAQADTGNSGGGSSSGGDSTEVTLPALGESVTEGTVTSWLKSVGDEVAVDEPLLEVSTDKVDTEVPSPVAGTLLEIRVDEDETVEVGAVLAVVGAAGSGSGAEQPRAETQSDTQSTSEPEPQAEPDTEAEPEAESKEETAEPAPESDQEESQREPAEREEPQPDDQATQAAEQSPEPSREPEPERSADGAASASTVQAEPATTGRGDAGASHGDGDGARSYVTPLVRKLAAQHGVELSDLTGTGVGGRIRKQDVLEAAEAAKQSASQPEPSAPAARTEPAAAASRLRGKTEKLSRLRKVIAARMVESLQVSAQLTTVVEVDVTAISRLRDRTKASFAEREGVKLSFLPFFAKAAIDALKSYPQVNASIDTEAGEVTYHDGEHLGVAVDTERGLLVPVIKDAGDLSIAGLARKIADLAARTRDNKISPDELSGGTFTLTNTGSRGALFDTPIINQPQVAILGTGAVVKRPVVISDDRIGETIAVRQMVYLALTYDHRLVDGADAARFLTAIKQRLEEANFEAELGG